MKEKCFSNELSKSIILGFPIFTPFGSHFLGLTAFIIFFVYKQFKLANNVLAGKIKKMKIDGEDKAKSHPAIIQSDLEKILKLKQSLLTTQPHCFTKLFSSYAYIMVGMGGRGFGI